MRFDFGPTFLGRGDHGIVLEPCDFIASSAFTADPSASSCGSFQLVLRSRSTHAIRGVVHSGSNAALTHMLSLYSTQHFHCSVGISKTREAI